jgi:carbon storage regulator
MLVLSRRPGEEIVIDGNIRLTIVELTGSRVRVGITAPPSVTVDRQEVHQRRAEQAAGASIGIGAAGRPGQKLHIQI